MKEVINLEKILNNISNIKMTFGGVEVFTKDDVLKAMREACNQAIELCAENTIIDTIDWDKHIVDKDSILDTKDQIK